MNTTTPAVGTLSHRLYLIWLAEGTDLADGYPGWPNGEIRHATARAKRAAALFYLRTLQDVLSYHVRMSQEEWERARSAKA